MRSALDPDDDFIEMPFVGWRRAIPPDPGRKLVPEAANPITDRFIGHRDAACRQKVFHVTQAQGEAMIGPDSVSDDAPRKPEALDPGQIFESQRGCRLPGRNSANNLTVPLRGGGPRLTHTARWDPAQFLRHEGNRPICVTGETPEAGMSALDLLPLWECL